MIINFRLKKLMEILLESDSVLTGEQLCNILGVSSRTIRSDVRELNCILENEGASINSEKSRGYQIEVFNENKFKEFLKTMREKYPKNNLTAEGRAETIIIKLLVNEINSIEGITQLELADELYVSLSSLKNDIKLAKNILQNFNLDIEKIRNKGIKINGLEERIRSCVNRYSIKNNRELNICLVEALKTISGKEGEVLIERIIKHNISKFDFRLTDIAYKDLFSYIKILLVRSYNKNNLYYDEKTIKKLKNEPKYDIAKSICMDIEREIKITLPDNEVLYLTKHISSCSQIIRKRVEEKDLLEREDELIIEILLSIKGIFNIDFIKDNTLIDFLGPHLKASINRAKYGITLENSMLGLIKNNYPFALELAVLANNIIKNYVGFNLSEDDIGFIALHFAAALERLKYKEVSKIKDVIVVCTTGVGTSLLIKVKLESYFKNRLRIIDTISSYEFNEDVLEKVDLVISTVPLEIKSSKVIHIKSLLGNQDIKKIEENLGDIISLKNSIADIFKEILFFTDVELNDRNGVLNFLTDQLLEKDYINNSVKEEAFQREELASTEIGNLVAIPHVMSDDIKESFISVVILKKGITWQKEQVQLVLFIGMSSEDKNQWKCYLEKLYKNIIETDVVQKIIKCTTFEDLKKVIIKF